ncbi:MAG: metal ABC transporter permease [Phycisphaerales bacterium]|nr:metal ABC transporter permease [Phycisphaerales bacterium]
MIPQSIQTFLSLDLFPLLAALFAAISCGLLGNFLVLRKQSLMGDAISHAVLPGLVAAFLITQSRSPGMMFIGAAISALITVVLVEVIKRLGKVEPGAAMGVVFSVLFALGVFLLENAAARSVDLDADCVLHGNLQTLFWISPPDQWSNLFSAESYSDVPRQVWTLAGTTLGVTLFVSLFFKELKIASFDAGIATVQGINAGFMHMLLMTFVAIAAVASFEAVGSILVIAMFICPAATARMLTDRLKSQIFVSIIVAALTAIVGYAIASWVEVNAAGMIASASGVFLVIAIVSSPRHGVIAKTLNQRQLGNKVALEDVLGALYRISESDSQANLEQLIASTGADSRSRKALSKAQSLGLVNVHNGILSLSKVGESRAASIIRRHRLWEGYLVEQAGLSPDHVHETAEQLEHFVDVPDQSLSKTHTDPHGKPIPPR